MAASDDTTVKFRIRREMGKAIDLVTADSGSDAVSASTVHGAVRLAVAMRDRTAELSALWKRRGHELELGIGIAVGFATCGEIGFDGRTEYTAIGTVVKSVPKQDAHALRRSKNRAPQFVHS
mgnify:CR=1 FL=1